ncbi:cadherin EGF LAG seven-pass G-type receptor 1-like [Porites lutea]|uniref:cadherin EGF LAG seven-pass G-type receptor 1-like n=1 Tax=Porites lutea TaxID=51062 RepID=UPI003CC6386D
MFKLKDSYQCSVLVAKALDFESKSSYLLNITASNYQSGFSNWTTLTISVRDEDDLPARFSRLDYTGFVTEDAAVGISVLQVTASDQDKLNASVTFEIVKSTNEQGLFIINASSGVISLNGTLDRESKQEYRLKVLARSTFHLPDHATAVIHVNDTNDNRPVFMDYSYSFFIGENAGVGAIVGLVKAADADKGDNAAFSYSLRGGEGRFIVDPHTGVIAVNGTLDREKQENFSFLVIAKETLSSEKYSSNVTVVVNVKDRNDNSPLFVKPFYNVTLKEELPPGTPVVQVLANDSDILGNAVIVYTLVPDVNNNYLAFDINKDNGSITTAKQLDREDISEYLLMVKAEDSASQDQTRSSTVSVKVSLKDINDNDPTFDRPSYTLTISEATDMNTTILTVKATDRDVGKNSKICFTMTNGNVGNVFSINHSSGDICVAKKLDREMVEDYSLVITATDGGNKSTSVNVSILVSDFNDNSPQFTSTDGYQFTVVEATAGLLVGSVKANDSDSGENAQIVYSLVSTPTSNSFRINSSTGEIFTNEALDREVLNTHLLIVQARDMGVPQLQSTAVRVSITVTDVNDNVPRFFKVQPKLNTVINDLLCGTYNRTHYYEFRVEDLTPANTEIGRVKSVDKDEDLNAKTFYRFQGNYSEVFSIERETGVIRTNRQLMRLVFAALQPFMEKCQQMPRRRAENATYILTVVAENSLASPPLSSNVTVHVFVYDVSDQAPQFTQSEYKAMVAESVTSGTTVIKINVTNSDKVKYFIFKILHDQSSAGSRKFVIEPETGVITVQGELDRETTANYTLKVQAKVLNTDLPGVFSNIVPVFINIIDVDDNVPRFVNRSYRFIAGELSRVGDVIGQVKAVDKDSVKQTKGFYVIARGNEKGLFNISEDLGTIQVVQTLERDANSTFHLIIQARDAHVGNELRKRRDQGEVFDQVTTTIEVQDENNNRPVFIQNIFIGGFMEREATENQIVANVKALDNDFGVYGSIKYSLVYEQDPGIFSLSPLTGEVTLTNPSSLVAGKEQYALAISAADNLAIVPYNIAEQNASVRIFVLTDSKELSLEIEIHPEFAREKTDEMKSMLQNLTGATVIINDILETGGGKSIVYFHAIDDSSLYVLDQNGLMSRLLNNTHFINGMFKKWNIHIPSDGSAEMSTGTRKEFSAVIAAMLVLSIGIGVAGIIGIVIACRKKKREKTIYKTTHTRQLSFPLATAWHSGDIPGIEAFIDAKAEETPRSLRAPNKYTVQREQAVPGRSSQSLLRTPLRSSKTYKMEADLKNDEEKGQAVALNHYGSSPSLPRPDHEESSEVKISAPSLMRTPLRSSKTYQVNKELKKDEEKQRTVAMNHHESAENPSNVFRKCQEVFETVYSEVGDPTMTAGDVESYNNVGFEPENGTVEEQRGERRPLEISVEEKREKESENADKSEGSGKDRRVRFDLRGLKEKKQQKKRRLPMGQIPDIIVISEEGRRGGNSKMENNEERRAVDDESDDDNLPADITSVFDDSSAIGKEISNLAENPVSAHASVISDEEGTVVEI